MTARSLSMGVIVTALCGLGVLAATAALRMDREDAFDRAVAAAAQTPGALPMRLVAPPRSVFAGLGRPSDEVLGQALAAAVDAAKADRSPDVQHAAGLSCLLTDAPVEATEYLDVAAHGKDDAVFWTHLGASQYILSLRDKDDERLLASLGALSHALVLDSARPEAAYNFALAVESLGVTPAAVKLWKSYLGLPDKEVWKNDARRHLSAISTRMPANLAWSVAVQRENDDQVTLERLTQTYPQQARLWTEGEGLSKWAEAMRDGDRGLARRYLDRARIIGRALVDSTGESLVSEAVAVIDRSQDESARLNALIEGHLHYYRGRRLYRDNKVSDAQRELASAAAYFAVARSPMSNVARSFVASTLHDADRSSDAQRLLVALLAAEEQNGLTHYALRAQLHYQLARTDVIRGFWSDTLAQSMEALTLYRRIRESGNEGMSASLIAEAYDFIGQPAVAVKHGIMAIRLFAEAGDLYKLRVTTANLCRLSMRRRMWDTAQAFIRVERLLEPLSPDPVLSAEMCMRAAVVEQNFGRADASERALHAATENASHVPDGSLKAFLLAYISGTRGALMRRRDPARAITLLDQAISYDEHTERAILLPQLYLERGRVQLALQRDAEALNDFERGIAELEKQRSHVNDPRLRYGIFDDSHELFAEAVELYLREGKPEAAFAVTERGRARALLEQIAGTSTMTSSATLPVDAVRQSIPSGTLLVEYATLSNRLLLFLITSQSFDVQTVPVEPGIVAKKSAALLASLVQRRTIEEVQAASADMYDLLIRPLPELSRYQRLVLVPAPELQQIPFAALFDRHNQRYLVEQHLFTTSPSAAIFVETKARARSGGRMPPQRVGVFVGMRAAPTLLLRRLPEIDHEAEAVARAYPQASIHRGTDASIDKFLSVAADYDVVHFSGHALIDPADPAQSALVMGTRGGEPALLRCSQIGTARFRRPRVVVLAACSTMRGRTGLAEGTPSIARSFLAAGVPAVVGTLWDVDDAETSRLVLSLHQSVAAGLTPAAALRNAQLAALHGGYRQTRHPAAWAAFSLLGAGGL